MRAERNDVTDGLVTKHWLAILESSAAIHTRPPIRPSPATEALSAYAPSLKSPYTGKLKDIHLYWMLNSFPHLPRHSQTKEHAARRAKQEQPRPRGLLWSCDPQANPSQLQGIPWGAIGVVKMAFRSVSTQAW